jgi:ArsR family transcriptional regulator, arsenate/arsenite/antimonite-responsive transcriptional repressor
LNRWNVEMNAADAVAALAALAHEYRLAAYRILVEAGPEGLPAGGLATRLKLPPSSLTFHLQNLQRAELITQRREGRQLIYSADFAVMNSLVGYLTENCCKQSGAAEKCDAACAPAPRASMTRKLRRTA